MFVYKGELEPPRNISSQQQVTLNAHIASNMERELHGQSEATRIESVQQMLDCRDITSGDQQSSHDHLQGLLEEHKMLLN